MRSFAQTATYSWMNGMIIRSAHSASMTHAKDHDSGVYASDGRMTRHLSAHTDVILSSGVSKPPVPLVGHRSPVPGSAGAGAQVGLLPQ
jgi:hypothetical protein